jgi:hypothetical protein
MDFSRFDRHTFIADLARAEDDATAALSRMLAPYVHYGAAGVPDWVFHHGERVRRVERALQASPALALSLLGRQLNNIDLREIWPILRGVLEDVALYLGGPAALGGALGGGIGFLAGGVGFVPGALAGSAAGAAAGSLLLSLLGLKSLVQYMLASVPMAAECYLRAFKMAWGPVAQDGHRQGNGSRILHRSDFACCASPDFAAEEFARGHVVIVLAPLAAIVAYLTRGRGDLPALLAEIRASPRLGPKMAAWVEQNAEKLKNQPVLQTAVLQTAHQNGGLGELAEVKAATGRKRAAANVADGAGAAGLRSAKQLLGQNEGGPGAWQVAPKRSGGEAYQEQITGVERGFEYDVPYAAAPSGKVSFDGYDAERGVLLDAKDWKGYPPAGATFWQKDVVKQALSQTNAANGMPIEWHFSAQAGMDAVHTLFEKEGVTDIKLVLTR